MTSSTSAASCSTTTCPHITGVNRTKGGLKPDAWEPIQASQIEAALAPYHPEYRMVTSAWHSHQSSRSMADVHVCGYPFTSSPMPYASLQLLSLASEQVALVHFRHEVQRGALSTAHWKNLPDYDRKVSSGHWVVPRLEISARSPVDVRSAIRVVLTIASTRITSRGYLAKFSATSDQRFSVNGTVAFRRAIPTYDQ